MASTASGSGASPAEICALGANFVLFGAVNLGLGVWARRRRRAGLGLPHAMRTLSFIVDRPVLFLGGVVTEVAIGLVLLAIGITQATH